MKLSGKATGMAPSKPVKTPQTRLHSIPTTYINIQYSYLTNSQQI